MIRELFYDPLMKLNWFGEGEWVNEHDFVYWVHLGIECKVRRVVRTEPFNRSHVFGGHLCGYCKLPENHPWLKPESLKNAEIDVHGGITSQIDEQNWIGFDCAHLGDITPSMGSLLKRTGYKLELFKGEAYKNIAYAIKECNELARQISEAMNATNT